MCTTKVVDERLQAQVQKMGKIACGTTRHGEESGEALIWCRKCSGYARQKNGTLIDELLQAGDNEHEGIWNDVKTNRAWSPCRGCERMEILKGKKEGLPERTMKDCRRNLRLEVSLAQKVVNTTPQMTCFRGAKVCTKWLQEKVTIKAYSLTISWNWEQVTS